MEAAKKKLTIITSTFVTIGFILFIILIVQFIKIGNLNNTKNNLESTYNQIQEQIYDYTNQNNILNQESTLEDYAHSALNYGKDGEIWFTGK